jgi:hypothetical protein
LPLVFAYVRSLHPEVYGAEPRFGIKKLGVAGAYPYPNVLAIVCCGIPQAGAKPLMVVQLKKWFISWVAGFGCGVSPTDVLLD